MDRLWLGATSFEWSGIFYDGRGYLKGSLVEHIGEERGIFEIGKRKQEGLYDLRWDKACIQGLILG